MGLANNLKLTFLYISAVLFALVFVLSAGYNGGGTIGQLITLSIVLLVCYIQYKQKIIFTKQSKREHLLDLFAALLICSSFIIHNLPPIQRICNQYNFPTIYVAIMVIAVLSLFVYPQVWHTNKCLENSSFPKFHKILLSKTYYIVCAIISLSGVGLLIRFSISKDIWLDEAWTLKFIEPALSDSMKLLMADVHPPLYYLITKGVISIWHAINPATSEVFIARLVSLFPIVILSVISLTYVRKKWNRLCSGIFAIAIACLSPQLNSGIELRMYSWALLFVTLTYLTAYRIREKSSFLSWAAFLISSIFAAYTHYFAVVAVIPAYIYTLYTYRKKMWIWFTVCACAFVLYLPWLFVFIDQLFSVRESFWIKEMNIYNIMQYMYHPVSATYGGCMGIFFILFYCMKTSASKTFSKSSDKNENLFCFLSLFSPFFVTIIGITVSIIMRPIFLDRYMNAALGSMWLGIIPILYRQSRCLFGLLVSILIPTLGVLNLTMFAISESENELEAERFLSFMQGQKNVAFISSNIGAYRTASVIVPSRGYLWMQEPGNLSKKTFDVEGVFENERIRELLNDDSVLYFISCNKQDIVEFRSSTGLTCKHVGKFRIGASTDLYRISK